MPAASETIDESAAEATPRPSLALRAKRLLIAPLLLLRRLRRTRAQEEVAEPETARPHDRSARHGKADGAETPAATTPFWRRFLPYAMVLLAGIAAGGGGSFWLSAKIIAHQSAELSGQEGEIARLKGMLAGYDKMMLDSHRKLEAEKGKQAELGNRLAIAQSDLAQRPQREVNRHADAPAQAGTGKTLDCTLRPGSIGSTLRACLEEFNRK